LIWLSYYKIHILRDIAKSVFYGSVFSDILDGSHYTKLFIEAGRSACLELTLQEANDLIWKPIETALKQ
jgi:hypothetical protein